MTYESAYQELETIYAAINNEEVSIDELAKKVKRAALLISLCQSKLKNTEEEISKILANLPNDNPKNHVGIFKAEPSEPDDVNDDENNMNSLPF